MIDISVIIPTFNRPQVLAKTLSCLDNQQTTARFEVIVVNDGPADALPLLGFGAGARAGWSLIQNPQNSGRAVTRNKGIQAAQGEYVLFLDDDIWAAAGLVQAHWDKQRETGGGVVLGAVPPAPEIENTLWHRYLAKRYKRIHERLKVRELDYRLFFTGNVSMPRALLSKAGRFNEDFKTYSLEDSELGLRLQQSGVRYYHEPRAIGCHFYHEDLDSLCRKAYQSGVSTALFTRLYPAEQYGIDSASLHYGPWKGINVVKNCLKACIYSIVFRNVGCLLLNLASVFNLDWMCTMLLPWMELSFRAHGFRQESK